MAYLIKSLDVNSAEPQVMHIDLNSAFATIEQQAHVSLRSKPVGVSSYTTPGGIILAASYEAKALGIKTGTPNWLAKQLCPSIFIMMPDPEKYFYVNSRLFKLLYSYTSDITPLSIDEFAVDFAQSRKTQNRPLVEVATEIKARIKSEIGEAIRVNIGIGANRFLAKTAAGLHKPDGLDVISSTNIRDVYDSLTLTDLCGINHRYEARLNVAGIYTPLEFLDADVEMLHKRVFKSIEGFRWAQRLRGWEVDGVVYGRKSYGHDYAIYLATADVQELSQLLMKLCEKTGRRLRRNGYIAKGAQIWLLYDDGSYWHKSTKGKSPIYSTHDIYLAIQRLFNARPSHEPISKLGVSVYGLEPTTPEQLELFETLATKQRVVAKAIDNINDRYGEFTVVPALMMNMGEKIIKRVPFGAVKDLKNIYAQYQQEY